MKTVLLIVFCLRQVTKAMTLERVLGRKNRMHKSLLKNRKLGQVVHIHRHQIGKTPTTCLALKSKLNVRVAKCQRYALNKSTQEI